MKCLNSFCKLILLSVGLVVSSCQKEESDPLGLSKTESENINVPRMTKLGKKLENPYSIGNMKKAWKNLSKKYKISKNGEIETTHLYIKFKPKTMEELGILKQDSSLVLYDVPLDYEIDEGGDFYHDPEVPISQPTYQYAAIPINKSLSNTVEYVILEELFIPDEDFDSPETSKVQFASNEIIEQLVDESLRLTGNLKDTMPTTSLAARRRKWRPAGTIRVYDHVTRSYVGVSGVKVRARRWFTTRRGFTNNNGRFSCNGRFRRAANYSIKWDRYQYSIRSGSVGQAILNGPKRQGDWNVNLGNQNSTVVNDRQQYYALIHQGALDYYYGGRFGTYLASPKQFSKKTIENCGEN